MQEDINNVKFGNFRKYDRILLRKILEQENGIQLTINRLVDFFIEYKDQLLADEERLYLLGQEISSVCRSIPIEGIVEELCMSAAPKKIQEIFIAGYERRQLSDEPVKMKTKSIIPPNDAHWISHA